MDGIIIAPAQDEEPYLKQLADSGFPVVQVIRGLESGMDAVMIDNFRIAYDAVVAASDPKAIVVMRAIRDAGMRIPEDISVIGMDDIETSSFFEPRLTTMAQPFIQIGELAAQKLTFHIDHPDSYTPVTDVLHHELIIRKSTR